MSQVFISHVEADAAVAETIADGLGAAGYVPWCYERNSVAGVPYITQVLTAIGQSDAVIVILSPSAFASLQVDKEIIQAYESAKPFIPLLHGISHADFRAHKAEWAMMLGASTSVAIPPEDVGAVIPRVVEGLQAMGIRGETQLASQGASGPLAAALSRADQAPGEVAHGQGATGLGNDRLASRGSGRTWPLFTAAGGAIVVAALVGLFSTGVLGPRGGASSTAAVDPAVVAPSPPSSPMGFAPLRKDDFSDPKGGLFADNQQGRFNAGAGFINWDYGYTGGALVGRVRGPYPPGDARFLGPRVEASDRISDDFAVEAKAVASKSSSEARYGIYYQVEATTYSFTVGGDGRYALHYNLVGAPTPPGNTYRSGRTSQLSRGQASDRLRIEVRGDTIRCYVNGTEIDSAQDEGFARRPASVGLFIAMGAQPAEDEVEVHFTDFKLYALGPAQQGPTVTRQ